MNLTPSQRHALRVICGHGALKIGAIRHSMRTPVRSLAAKGLVHSTERGIEPTEAGWEKASHMNPPVARREL